MGAQNMMWVGPVVAILSLLLLVAATTALMANAASKLPPTCDESSDDKECATFQIVVNQSHLQQPYNVYLSLIAIGFILLGLGLWRLKMKQ